MTPPSPHPIRAVICDLDGTLMVPALDFDAMRAEIGITASPILEALDEMTDEERRRAFEIIERHENEAAERSELSAGACELLDFIRQTGVRPAVVTRNSRTSVEKFTARHRIHFDAVVTRDDAPPNPSPVPLQRPLEPLSLTREEAIYVGDHEIDRLTGEAAGIPTYIVKNHPELKDSGPPEMRVDTLAQIIGILRRANAQ